MIHTKAAYCPYCRTVTNLNLSITVQPLSCKKGKVNMAATKTWHCESCCSFVRSEDEKRLMNSDLRLTIYEVKQFVTRT